MSLDNVYVRNECTFCRSDSLLDNAPIQVELSALSKREKSLCDYKYIFVAAQYFNPRKWASNGPRLLSVALADQCGLSPEDFAQALSIGPGMKLHMYTYYIF